MYIRNDKSLSNLSLAVLMETWSAQETICRHISTTNTIKVGSIQFYENHPFKPSSVHILSVMETVKNK